MNKAYLFLCLILLTGISSLSMAQTDPGTANLKHLWTFDNGVVDEIGGLTGTLEGAATVANKALNTSTGGYFNMPAAEIGINAYPSISTEVWFTSAAGVNTGFTMLSYFGNTTGSVGTSYFFTSTARGDNVSRAAVSCNNTASPWATETGVNGTEYDDGKLHQMVSIVTDTTIMFYIDGARIGSATLSTDNKIPNIGTSFAYLCKAGYTGDPTWKGNIHRFAIYNKVLNDNEVLYLFQKGPEKEAVLTATASNVALDNNYYAEQFNVSGANLGANIEITAPNGITVVPSSLDKAAKDAEVYVVWDTTTPVNGKITLKSGATVVEIPVKTADDTQCYKPLYDNVTNLVGNTGCNNLSFFAGWGSKEISNIITDPANVNCGASSISVGSGTATGSGSLDVGLTGKLKPNTFYRVKAMVKTTDGTMQVGVWGWSNGQGDINNVVNTNGEWQVLDFTFTTGATLGGTQGMFFNNWACSGTKGYIDNWEMYEAIEPKLSSSIKTVAFDPEYKQLIATVTGANLTEAISVIAPAGITVVPASLPMDAAGDTLTITWDGTTQVNGKITLSTSGITQEIAAKSTITSNTACFVPLYTNKVNMVPDPYMNDMKNFGGWGGKSLISIVDSPDSVLCGSHAGKIVTSGSIDVILTGKMKKSTSYIARAMIMTIGGSFQLGVWGMDALFTGDMQDTLDTQGTWMPITLEFATSDTLRADQGMFFNNYQRTGKRAFIDNWELYDLGPLAVTNPLEGKNNVFVNNGRIVAEFELNGNNNTEISVFSLQGTLINRENIAGVAGKNRHELSAILPSGAYLVRIASEGRQFVGKVIK
jgi:hypothetical protein